MSSSFMFLVGIISLISVVFIFNFGSVSEVKDYFKTKTGKGIAKGIIIALGVGLLFSLFSCSVNAEEQERLKWFDYRELYLGIEHTSNKTSPQCIDSGVNDRLTSNLGFTQNIFVSTDRKFHFNAKYTHHSCVLNSDRNTYDAFGVEFILRF